MLEDGSLELFTAVKAATMVDFQNGMMSVGRHVSESFGGYAAGQAMYIHFRAAPPNAFVAAVKAVRLKRTAVYR